MNKGFNSKEQMLVKGARVSNSWAADAKLDNCMAMVDSGRRYGIYPIGI